MKKSGFYGLTQAPPKKEVEDCHLAENGPQVSVRLQIIHPTRSPTV
ncbi:hypothetical protein JST97_35350 [bacterium]|nr:hypothetical protein [bacterium]